MHFIKSIFLGKDLTEDIHKKFIKYGRGEFTGPSIEIKKVGKDEIKVRGSIDYVTLIGKIVTSINLENSFSFSGKIILKVKEMEDLLNEELKKANIEIKKFKKDGFFTYEVNGSCNGKELYPLYDKFVNEYLLIDLNLMGKQILKTKKKLPKPGSVDENFFSAILNTLAIQDLIREVAFDINNKNFSELKIFHRYVIEELIIPEEYKNNFKEARIHAKRKGKILRVIDVDGVKEEKEMEMLI